MTVKGFAYTGAVQTFIVPPGVFKITAQVFGAAGFRGWSSIASFGGFSQGDLAVTPGETLWIYVGGAANSSSGGWNGGGNGGAGHSGFSPGGGGGGGTDVRQGGQALSNRKIVAGGGGGQARFVNVSSSSGGGLNGQVGGGSFGGGFGTQTGAGAIHTGAAGGPTNGSLGQGGNGGNNTVKNGGGGGGGGYYGGAGGGLTSGTGENWSGGGGGSGYYGALPNGGTTSGTFSTGHGSASFTYDVAPSAPTLTDPASNQFLDATLPQTFKWNVNDPDSNNIQAKFELTYQDLTAGTVAVVIAQTTSSQQWVAPASTFVPGDTYQWSVRTQDTAGLWSPSSDPNTFTASSPQTAPVITSPAPNATLTATPTEVDWTIPGQNSYQIQRVQDNGGVSNPAVVYYDSGETSNPSGLTGVALVPFDPIVRSEFIRVRVKFQAAWSAWAEVRVVLNINPPSNPIVELFPESEQTIIAVKITNPAGGASDTAYNDLYRDDGSGEIRVAKLLDADSTWVDYTPGSGITYGYRAVAFAVSGAQASSV